MAGSSPFDKLFAAIDISMQEFWRPPVQTETNPEILKVELKEVYANIDAAMRATWRPSEYNKDYTPVAQAAFEALQHVKDPNTQILVLTGFKAYIRSSRGVNDTTIKFSLDYILPGTPKVLDIVRNAFFNGTKTPEEQRKGLVDLRDWMMTTLNTTVKAKPEDKHKNGHRR